LIASTDCLQTMTDVGFLRRQKSWGMVTWD